MKNIIVFFILLLNTCFFIQAQDLSSPQGFKLEKPSDYAKYHDYIIEAAQWLENTPLNEEVEKRRAIQNFVQKWTAGSPSVRVNKQAFIDIFTEKNPNLFPVFLAAWASYQIQHPEEKNLDKLHAIGLTAMNKVYQMGGAKEEKFFNKLAQIIADGDLETWVGYQLEQ